jgi:hypothetical protein
MFDLADKRERLALRSNQATARLRTASLAVPGCSTAGARSGLHRAHEPAEPPCESNEDGLRVAPARG